MPKRFFIALITLAAAASWHPVTHAAANAVMMLSADASPLLEPGKVLTRTELDAIPGNVPPDTDPPGTVRLVCAETDVAKRYKFIVPPLPFPPFSKWRQWWTDHAVSVHCALEWKDDKGNWAYSEIRSSKWDKSANSTHRVGAGQFPCTGYVAYSIYIFPGRLPRVTDQLGRPVITTQDEAIKCDYKRLEYEIRKYGAFGKSRGDPCTGNYGKDNCGLGGPAYKPAQNSNTMINYVLHKCGVNMPPPDRAVGWDTTPEFPYSSDTHFPKYDNQP